MGVKLIDLSETIVPGSPSEPWPAKINYLDHRTGALEMKERFNVDPNDLIFSKGLGWSYEFIEAMTHTGTHLDAPWHFHPVVEGKLAKTIDEIPLEWCYSDGVVLDMRHKPIGEFITVEDLKTELERIGYQIKPYDIVLIMTGADKRIGTKEYFLQPGMSREATLWLIDQGVKITGIDAYTWDRPFSYMAKDYQETRNGSYIWPAHFAAIEKEYCHIEKLRNLDKIPKPYGFKVCVFPIKIFKASAGWVRAVAIVEE